MSLDNLNRFTNGNSGVPVPRSRFKMPFSVKTTFNSGDLVPFMFQEIYPGDTFKLNTRFVCRGLTPVVPVMDNSFLDIFYFFVPRRLCADSKPGEKLWEQVFGENVNGYWAPDVEAELRECNFYGCEPGSLANYFGLPLHKSDTTTKVIINPDIFEAYNLIWNEWFRDENTQAPVDIYRYGYRDVNDTEYAISNTSGDKHNYGHKGSCLKVNKFHDYFTSALPAPQKGPSVLLPLADQAPVITTENHRVVDNAKPMFFANVDDNEIAASGIPNGGGLNVAGGLNAVPASSSAATKQIYPTNLVADLTSATSATINNLRQAFAIQRMFERDARGGSRYIELIKSHFGVGIRNDVVQRPEYLGGFRTPINVTQVLQTGASTGEQVLGDTGAFSNTSGINKSFTKSFRESGFIIGLLCVRTSQSYSQGINKSFFRRKRFDFYWPAFAHLGEQPIYNKELFASWNAEDDKVFGYQEAWADLKYRPGIVTGLFAPGADDVTMAPWTYVNRFSKLPVLNSDFMKQDLSNIQNTLSVTENTGLQFFIDMYLDMVATRCMPLYSYPGLIDHF